MRLIIVTTHPIQYQAPLFRALARRVDLAVVFMMQMTARGQAEAGFGREFQWDVPLLDGYEHVFAENVAEHPTTSSRYGIVLRAHEELLESLNPEAVLIFGWFPHGYIQVADWTKRRRVPLVGRGDSNLLSPDSSIRKVVKEVYLRKLFRRFKSFAAVGIRNREYYRHYGVPDYKIHNAPHSVDTDFFKAQYELHRPIIRKRGPWRIGFAGKFAPVKRVGDLIAAAQSCRSTGRIELILIGDGPLRSQIEQLISASGIAAEIRGFMNQSEIVKNGYADLDAIVLPSVHETWGLVVNEAMTGGIPAIVADTIGCAPDLVRPDETGYVFRSGNVEELGACIDRLVARLQAGHAFAPAVHRRISQYSLGKTVDGVVASVQPD